MRGPCAVCRWPPRGGRFLPVYGGRPQQPAAPSPAPLRIALAAGEGGLSVRILKRRGRPAARPLILSIPRPGRTNRVVAGPALSLVAARSAALAAARLAPSSRAAGCWPATGRRQRPGSAPGRSCRRRSACNPDCAVFERDAARETQCAGKPRLLGRAVHADASAWRRRPACCWKSAAACACSAGRRPSSMPCSAGCAEQAYSVAWAVAPTPLGARWLAQAGSGAIHPNAAGHAGGAGRLALYRARLAGRGAGTARVLRPAPSRRPGGLAGRRPAPAHRQRPGRRPAARPGRAARPAEALRLSRELRQRSRTAGPRRACRGAGLRRAAAVRGAEPAGCTPGSCWRAPARCT